MKTTATLACLLLAGVAHPALAATDCTVDALNALHVPGVSVAVVENGQHEWASFG